MEKLKTILFLFVLTAARELSAQDIEIGRGWSGKDCTLGRLWVNGKEICLTLERAGTENAMYTKIPVGIYDANIRFDHKDHWRIELIGVPKRTFVQIHIGNSINDTSGCILVGTEQDFTNCTISGSAIAYKKMKEACIFSNGQRIRVKIS